MSQKTVQTIEDIARLANVSKSTVSRALNNSPLINEATRQRIQAIARQHNFRLNAPARNLSLRQSHTVAFVASSGCAEALSAEDLFGMEILSGIGSGLHTLGYDLLVVHVNPRDTTWANDYLVSGRVDGFVLMSSCRKQWHLKTLVEIGAPFIAWGAPLPKSSYCTVTGDNLTGGRLATRHLLRSGRQRIGFLAGPAEELEAQQRLAGYQEALQDAGISPDPALQAQGDYSYASGTSAMQRLLEQAPDLQAVFACSDLMAIGAIHTLQARGKRIPQDVAVVGYDDLSIARYNNLPLTTVRQNIPLAGQLLAQNLIQYIQTGVVTNVTLPVELVLRQSA